MWLEVHEVLQTVIYARMLTLCSNTLLLHSALTPLSHPVSTVYACWNDECTAGIVLRCSGFCFSLRSSLSTFVIKLFLTMLVSLAGVVETEVTD